MMRYLLKIIVAILAAAALITGCATSPDAGKSGKLVLGGLLVVVGLLILSGLDKRLETLIVEASPTWLTEITTRY